MNFTELGYQTVLVDLGVMKVAGVGSKIMDWGRKLLSKAPVKAGPGPSAMAGVERAAAGIKPRGPVGRKANNLADDVFAGKAPKTVAPPAPKNPVAPEAPAMTPPQNEAAGGLLAKIRRNPVKSVGIAGAGAGGLGYVMGQGAQQQEQPMQQYGQPQQMY